MSNMEYEGYQVTWTDSKQHRREALKKLAMGTDWMTTAKMILRCVCEASKSATQNNEKG